VLYSTVCRMRADCRAVCSHPASELCIKAGKWNKSVLWCTVKKTIKEVIAVYREDTNVRMLFRVKIMVVIVKWRDLSGRLSENKVRVKWHWKSVPGVWVKKKWVPGRRNKSIFYFDVHFLKRPFCTKKAISYIYIYIYIYI
jgi:hypothetical protein